MEIILKSDWDVRLQPPVYGLERKGHFAGRKEEIEHLVNEILRRENGAIAISGYRGVGKTSFVYHALHEVRQRLGNEKSIIVVLINAAQLETESEKQSIKPRTILINLIRRLYSTIEDYKIEKETKETLFSKIKMKRERITPELIRIKSKYLSSSQEKNDDGIIDNFIAKNENNEINIYKKDPAIYKNTGNSINISNDLKQNIEILYRKAVAVEFTITENASISNLISKDIIEEKKIEVTTVIKILFNPPIIMFSGFVGAILVFIESILNTPYIIPIGIAAVLSPPLLNFLYRRRLINNQHKQTKKNVEACYKFDNSVANLEFDLEKIHRDISSQEKIKLIYVIDEMDKLDLKYGMDIISYFKNFFTLTNAYFIFINGEKMHKWGEIENKPKKQIQLTSENENKKYPEKEHRPKAYTYFTSRYFLSRPLTRDLDIFFDSIVDNIEDVKDYKEFESFKRALYFDANNDFFDIKTCIKDKITRFDEKKNNPIIQYSKDDLVSINDVKKARFHSIVKYIFETHFMFSNPTKWQDNELLLRELFSYAHKIYSSDIGTEFSDPDDCTNLHEVNLCDEKADIYEVDLCEALCEAIRYFNTLLFMSGAFKILESNEKIIKGSTITIHKHVYIGDIPLEPKCVKTEYQTEYKTDYKTGYQTEYEKRFITKFEEYSNYINLLYDVFRNANSNMFNYMVCPDKFRIPHHFVVEQTSKWGFSTISQFDTYFSIYSVITMEKQVDSKVNFSSREKITPKTEELGKHMNILVNDLPKTIAKMIRNQHLNKDLDVQSLKEKQFFSAIFSEELYTSLQNSYHSVVSNEHEKGASTRQLLIISNISSNDEKEIEHFNNTNIEQIRIEIEKNAATHRAVIITDISVPNSEGVYVIQNKSPKEFCEELSRFLKDIKPFFW